MDKYLYDFPVYDFHHRNFSRLRRPDILRRQAEPEGYAKIISHHLTVILRHVILL